MLIPKSLCGFSGIPIYLTTKLLYSIKLTYKSGIGNSLAIDDNWWNNDPETQTRNR